MAIGFLVRALLTSEVEPFLQNILPSGSSGGSEASVNQAPNGADAGPSGAQNSSSWTEDSFEIRVLLEPFPETEMEGTSGNPTRPRVARDEAGPSNPHANMAERPIPQENPLIRPLSEEGNREALLNQCHRLVSAQLQHFFERGKKKVGALNVHSTL